MTAPDYAEPIIGWRAWHVVETDAGVRLHSVARDVVWSPATRHDAECLRRRSWRDRLRPPSPHVPPAWGCTCGIWAVRTPGDALAALGVCGRAWKPLHRVVGAVSLWGGVVEHAGGWRAEHAYPRSVLVPARRLRGAPVDVERLIDALRVYGVPIRALDAGSRPQLRDALAAADVRLPEDRRARRR